MTLAVAAAIIIVFRAATTKEEECSLGEVFTYDLEELRKTDPALIKYKQSGAISTGFQAVSAVAVDSKDRVYVAGDKSIRMFNNDGEVLSEIKLTDAPQCLAIADDGTIYIGMENYIEVYDSARARRAKWESAGENAILTSIAVSENDIFAANASGRVVLRYDSSGKLVSRIGERDKERNIPGFVVPSPYFDLAIAPDGLLRVVNPGFLRIEAYTYDGDMEFFWGRASMGIEGFCGCCNPVNFVILPDGRFVTCEKGLPRVKIYDSQGVFESVVAETELFGESDNFFVLDVAVDSQGRIMVLDPMARAVRIFTLLKRE